ncbi:hypothetical protein DL771_007404 [Monosporascus sp. 5C6A]|nr:hypothetical protein DL771_007404 [Monosporascus sp. 5C6A]
MVTQKNTHHAADGFAGTKGHRYVGMAVSQVAEETKGAFGRLLFLLVLVYAASSGLHECYELLHESLGLVSQGPFLAPASYWYRLPRTHRDVDPIKNPIETPMADFAYGLVNPVSPRQAFTGILEYLPNLDVNEASKYRGDPDYHQSSTGWTRSAAISTVDHGSQRRHSGFAPLSSTRCARPG